MPPLNEIKKAAPISHRNFIINEEPENLLDFNKNQEHNEHHVRFDDDIDMISPRQLKPKYDITYQNRNLT